QRIAPAGSRLLAPTSALPPWAWKSRRARLGAGRIIAQQIPPWQDGTTNFSYFRNYMNPYLNPHLFGLDDLGSTTGGSARIPWLWIVGAAIIGFLGCRLLQRKNK
ncbi:MAG: hypothetical protein RMK43_12905, partial [Cyclobacteriaceae bacterium]|nr:hypothetical protein [Cyclobacteriaceae bacterium]